MSNKRKQYSAEFKAKIALEAIKGEKSISEIASHYGVHPTMIHQWKRHLLDGASDLFERGEVAKRVDDTQAQIDELYRQIGQLKVEKDFLVNRSAKLGLPTEKPWSR
jgi:transposase